MSEAEVWTVWWTAIFLWGVSTATGFSFKSNWFYVTEHLEKETSYVCCGQIFMKILQRDFTQRVKTSVRSKGHFTVTASALNMRMWCFMGECFAAGNFSFNTIQTLNLFLCSWGENGFVSSEEPGNKLTGVSSFLQFIWTNKLQSKVWAASANPTTAFLLDWGPACKRDHHSFQTRMKPVSMDVVFSYKLVWVCVCS